MGGDPLAVGEHVGRIRGAVGPGRQPVTAPGQGAKELS